MPITFSKADDAGVITVQGQAKDCRASFLMVGTGSNSKMTAH